MKPRIFLFAAGMLAVGTLMTAGCSHSIFLAPRDPALPPVFGPTTPPCLTSTPVPSSTPIPSPSATPIVTRLVPSPSPTPTPTLPLPTSTPTPLAATPIPSPTPQPTFVFFPCASPVPVSGTCQSAASLTFLQGSSIAFTYYNTALNHTVASGAFPVGGFVGSSNFHNQYVIQTAADWANFVASSVNPAGSYAMPFDPATQMMVVISGTALSCCAAQTMSQICTSASQITIYVTWDGTGAGCVDNAGAGDEFYTQSQAVVLPKSFLPVVWSNPCGFPNVDCMIAN